ncbi:MAG: LysR substrate-binding domain-containing protein [Zymomonas mobilis subsp. pomaceae]|uniref:Transcriptional regulator, LysR family n=1 Tax=Zymomonas mobilis subsp. pomaceae (strain ATCC 29192 / DSM 22645 / JCM 10191 / CCUG 17912 / NBRC 13757 / NCIMB 11200 / NRRL B-4491 / Barker I) TaxID=579138 RepID=F8EVQ7_ZYMMT|nr:LysR substrate-binding domain-containing protein [Zymomonas mobilis]AEI38394.1 transcriptional regulator, LysR family [Zymomonas mobilis subsp. pomaceae ATCC 29192]MDX5948084.1 LysR substrate-binding domain-containing protein [Zymomonas mobilis subsp. pomaceae]GEB89413.1 LysR family transcriptional regulator [Zymomonas mobilis subsp. pomaceae]
MAMYNLNDIYYYVQVVEHGGFTQASRATGIPKSKLSRRITELENRLGVRLLQRSTRHFSVTEIGRIYFDHCQTVIFEAENAEKAIEETHQEPCGLVRLSCPIALLHATLSPILAAFLARYPKVKLQMEATNRSVNPISDAIDLAIRVRPLPFEDSDLTMRQLTSRKQILVASPNLIRQYAPLEKPEDLSHWPAFANATLLKSYSWQLFGPSDEIVTINYEPRFVTTDMFALQEAAIAGLGVVHLPFMIVRQALERGQLIELLPNWSLKPEIIHVVYPTRRGLLPSVRALLNMLIEHFKNLNDE